MPPRVGHSVVDAAILTPEMPPEARLDAGRSRGQKWLFDIIFGHNTFAGKSFDIVLLVLIVLSVIAVMAESVEGIRREWGTTLYAIEWLFTGLFTLEYLLRLYCVRRRWAYVLSFFGVVDLLAILPTYLSVLIPGAQGLATVRALRLLRIFRIFKLVRFMNEAAALRTVLWQSRAKIIVFLMTICIVVTIIGAMMYLVEQPYNPGFRNIPQSIYWAIVTMATVGYGDIVPMTTTGKFLAALLIVMGYSMIVVPTGIITAEWREQLAAVTAAQAGPPRLCPACGQAGHDADARFCKHCGVGLRGDAAS